MKIPHNLSNWHRAHSIAQSGTLPYRRLAVGIGEHVPAATSSSPRCALKRREDGMITVLFIALLAIMMVFVLVESQALIRLRREVKLLEQQQIKRLNAPPTNTVATVTIP
jgi:hypothetical protein